MMRKSLHIMIIEDEIPAQERLKRFLWEFKVLKIDIEVVGILRSVSEVIAWFAQNEMPDLIFSDIELLDGNAFSIYEQVTITCPIIFTTAYDQYLLHAFRINGIAYLLKPFEQAQFDEAFQKYFQLQQNFSARITKPEPESISALPTFSPELLAQFQKALTIQTHRFKTRFTVKMRGSIYLLEVSNIAYLQAEGGVVTAFDAQNKGYPLTGTLAQIEEGLDPTLFFRINRSDLVNLNFIQRLENYDKDRLAIWLTKPNIILISSANRTPELRRWLSA